MSTDKMTLGEILQAAEDYHAAMDDGELLGYRTVAEWLNAHPSATIPGFAGALEAFKSNVPWRADARRNRLAADLQATAGGPPRGRNCRCAVAPAPPSDANLAEQVGYRADLQEAVRTISLLREDANRLAKQSASWESAARSNRRQIDLGIKEQDVMQAKLLGMSRSYDAAVKAQCELQAALNGARAARDAAAAERDEQSRRRLDVQAAYDKHQRETIVSVQTIAGQRDVAQGRAKYAEDMNDRIRTDLRTAVLARGKAEQERSSAQGELSRARAERDEARRERDEARSAGRITARALGNVTDPIGQSRAVERAVGTVQHHRKDRFLSGEDRERAEVMAVLQSIYLEAGLEIPRWLAEGCRTGQTPATIGDFS